MPAQPPTTTPKSTPPSKRPSAASAGSAGVSPQAGWRTTRSYHSESSSRAWERKSTYRLDAEGRLVMSVFMTSEKLASPIVYDLVYEPAATP